ncbi:N,N-dimethylformamidase beta subunit family domain-containing protein [Streptomyces gardneri]|uniref:N,N-dimethylformamidase beta subunit family domain-containing protein n=1 Tax=Streptomyces gardneri TaxID=66892 RepID=UPI0035DF9EA0
MTERLLFYNDANGAGAIGVLGPDSFTTLHSYGPGGFATTWTHVAEIPGKGGKVLFYDADEGSAAVGHLTPDNFVTTHSYGSGSFGSWTHIVGATRDEHITALFYNSRTGAAALGFDPTVQSFPEGSFSTGWTAAVTGRRSQRVLFYNAETGAGALDFAPSTVVWGAGSFSTGWTDVAVGPSTNGQDALFFYNSVDQSGAVGLLGPDGFTTIRSWGPGTFGKWTLVAGTNAGWLFYNAHTGAAAIGTLRDGSFAINRTYPAGSFSTGWSHITHIDLTVLDMQGCCWPVSAGPGETIEFKTSTVAPSYEVTYQQYAARPTAEVGAAEIEASTELAAVNVAGPTSHPGALQSSAEQRPATGCESWPTSFKLTVPTTWNSGFYVARLIDSRGSKTHVPFVVQPTSAHRAPIALLANLSTWCAYNPWGGFSRYGVPHSDAWTFSYLRPEQGGFDPTRVDSGYHYNSKHLLRGELWAWNWLRDTGYSVDVHTDVDLHAGIDGLSDYAVVILANHPEYLSIQAMDALSAYLDSGGSLLYLGGNGLYDAVDISSDLRTLTTHGTAGVGRDHLFRKLGRPESSLLGVAFPWDAVGGDVGNNANSRVAYRVVDAQHRFFGGTGIAVNDEIGAEGWTIIEGSGSLRAGGASGWECDLSDTPAPDGDPMPVPAGLELLAVGTNPPPAASMVTYRHPGGGIVFSVGSMTFVGSLMVDPVLQKMMHNVLAECLT